MRRVTVALASKLDEFVRFPHTQEQLDVIKNGLYEIANFPCAIGLIGCSHMRNIASTYNEPDFVNRKRSHSINVERICDHKGTK